MKLALTLALTLAATLALGGCGETTELKFPREHRASYTCSIDQWEMVKKRINVCEQSRLKRSCPNYAIRAECTYKGDLIDDNSNSNQEETTTTPN